MNDPHDPPERLRTLAPPAQDPAAFARGHRRARAIFLQQHPDHPLTIVDRVWRVYFTAEPVLAASIAVVYLGWTFDTLASLWR